DPAQEFQLIFLPRRRVRQPFYCCGVHSVIPWLKSKKPIAVSSDGLSKFWFSPLPVKPPIALGATMLRHGAAQPYDAVERLLAGEIGVNRLHLIKTSRIKRIPLRASSSQIT